MLNIKNITDRKEIGIIQYPGSSYVIRNLDSLHNDRYGFTIHQTNTINMYPYTQMNLFREVMRGGYKVTLKIWISPFKKTNDEVHWIKKDDMTTRDKFLEWVGDKHAQCNRLNLK